MLQLLEAQNEPGPPRPGPARTVLVRLAARLRAGRLDRALAAGVDARTSPALAARAEMLEGRRAREAVASAIYRAVKDATLGLPRFACRVPVSRQAVRHNRRELLELAAELRQAAHVSARGVAATRLLIQDATGPLFHEAEYGALRIAVVRARSWL